MKTLTTRKRKKASRRIGRPPTTKNVKPELHESGAAVDYDDTVHASDLDGQGG